MRQEFMNLVEKHKAELTVFCRHMLWDRHDLADILQTVLMTAFSKFDSFETGTNFRAWLFQISTLTIFNYNRKYAEYRKRVVNLKDESIEDLAGLPQTYEYEKLLEQPQQILEHVDDHVHQALMSLTPKERTVVLLKTVVELSCKDIAVMMKIPMGSVMGYLGRARGKLRAQLQEYAANRGIGRNKPIEGEQK